MDASLAEQYKKQEEWRRWNEALSLVPIKEGQRVLDLGCGVGQMTARFERLGAQTIGIDLNEDLLTAARSFYPNSRFEKLDLKDLNPSSFGQVDGIWASFVAAYLGELTPIISQWSHCLPVGGWMALVEIDDLLGHGPLPAPMRDKVSQFYASMRGGYDFECGRKLASAAERAGLSVLYEGLLHDDELSFQGQAPDGVIEAWRLRLQRMIGLQKFFGEGFSALSQSLLEAMSSPEHHSTARVFLVIARKE